MLIRQLTSEDERMLRRWLLQQNDPEFAMHRQLKDYFLAPTATFGTAVMQWDERNPTWMAAIFFSRYNQKAFIHQYIGDTQYIGEFLKWLALPTQAFFRTPFEPPTDAWNRVLAVKPGYVVDHPAYDGVFSRVAPRFHGAVYETKDFQ